MTLIAHLWIVKIMQGAFYQLPKILNKSSHAAFLIAAKLFQFRNLFPWMVCICMDTGGFYVSSLGGILEPELTGLQGFLKMFSNQMWLDTRKNVFCRVFFPLYKSLLDVYGAEETSSLAKPIQKCAESNFAV